ncbi:unnamed protein product, partial [Musa acuminata var. zebrina]
DLSGGQRDGAGDGERRRANGSSRNTEVVLRFIAFGGRWSGLHETKKPLEFNRRSTMVCPPPLCFHMLKIRASNYAHTPWIIFNCL